ncbi:hypothetical protein ABT392_14095 [Paucibacter sp. JuS9]|uniref:hypothetical protein n=1 Tax=Roseateles TaxID=93681 RepID=UPI002FE5936D
MRAAFSILGLVIAFAVAMFVMKNQAKQLLPPVPQPVAGTSQAASSAAQLPLPAAVGAQVQGAIDQAAARASEAQP